MILFREFIRKEVISFVVNINKEDILEIQEILLKSINDNNNELKIKINFKKRNK